MAGCFGENSSDDEINIAGFQINFTPAEDAELSGGEWHTFFPLAREDQYQYRIML